MSKHQQINGVIVNQQGNKGDSLSNLSENNSFVGTLVSVSTLGDSALEAMSCGSTLYKNFIGSLQRDAHIVPIDRVGAIIALKIYLPPEAEP